MRPIALLAALLLAWVASAAQAPLLDRLTVHATGAVSITVPVPEPPENPVFRAEDGTWKPLNTGYADGRVSFDLPAETGGSTVVLLRVPAWLDFDDDTAPEIKSLRVADQEIEPRAEVDLGHMSGDALSLSLTVADAHNPVDAGSAAFILDGVPLTDEQASFLPAEGKGLSRTAQVALTGLKPDQHSLRISIPDAAAKAHVAEMRVAFNTAPLLADGGFEKVNSEGKPVHWTANMWSTDAATKAEVKIAEGARSGKYCAELTGTAGSLNLLWGQQVYLTGGKTYKVTGYCRATKALGYLSMIADGTQAKQQYVSSPRLPASDGWERFEWTFAADPASRYTLYLRSGGVGSVWFDDVTLEEVAAE